MVWFFKLSFSSSSQLQLRLTQALEEIGSRGSLYLVLDGLELLDSSGDATALSWLPDPLPNSLRVIVSACKGPTRRGDASKAAPPLVVPPLDARDRSAIVRSTLRKFGKELAEGAFDNQVFAFLCQISESL